MTEVVNPGENTAISPPADPAAQAAPPADSGQPNPQPTPNGSEPDINPGGQQEPEMVPSGRLREETEKRRQAEERVQELENAQQQPAPPNTDEEELDPDVLDTIRRGAKKLGFVSQDELAQERQVAQVRQDVQELEKAPPVAGIAYNHREVLAHAEANNLPITSKSALVAAYKELNWGKILEAERNRAIDGFKTGGAGGEKPGPTGPTPPAEPEISGRNPKERIKNRIGLARQKLAR